jgi:hypothetical protein
MMDVGRQECCRIGAHPRSSPPPRHPDAAHDTPSPPLLASYTGTMAAYFFASQVDIDVRLEGEDTRKQVDIKSEKDPVVSAPVFFDGDSLVGQVRVQLLAMSHT